MANSEDIKLIIEAQDKASKQLDTITKALGGFVETAEKSAGTLAKLGKAAAGLFALDKAKDFLASGIQGYAAAEKSAVVLEHTLRQTGNTAGMTAQQIMDYAESIESTTGIEAESVQDAAAMLARNSKITGDQFKDILRIATDMTAVEGTVASNAEQLARALTEPETALSKLRSTGIVFTEDQEKVIKSLIETGKETEAMAMILEKADAKFAGMAQRLGDTTAGKLAKLENLWDGFKEGLAGIVVDNLVDPIEGFVSALNGVDAAKIDKILEMAERSPGAVEFSGNTASDFDVLQERFKASENMKASIEKQIEELRTESGAEAFSNVFGDGSVAEEANRQWEQLHVQLEKIKQDQQDIINQTEELNRIKAFGFLVGETALGANIAANRGIFNNMTQGGVAQTFAQGSVAAAQQIQGNLAEQILRSNETQKQKLEKELQELLSVETLLPENEFKRIRERIEAELKAIAEQAKTSGISALIGGAESIFEIAERQAAKDEADMTNFRPERIRDTPGLQALESRFLTRGPGNDPALGAAMEGNKIAREQLKQLSKIANKKDNGPQVVVRGI